ncbi:MAG: type III-B CRISPR module RAMP protein Cmr1 [Anaerolineae bacterium]|nr:type III-B CRISPR module RAMP protein Cmr1 [Anaerolineae bacterium]
MELEIKMLTPLWTGGVESGKMDRVHETGIIGSLRWWYEAIVRGLGGRVCDPTKHSCVYDLESSKDGLCDACQLFGATGWRRRFRLVVDGSGLRDTWSGGQINIKPPGRNHGWYLNAGKMGTLKLKIIAEPETQSFVLALLKFIEKWGNLGARPQLGYGLFSIVKVNELPQSTYSWNTLTGGENNHNFPDLRTFTFFALNFEPQSDDWWQTVPGIDRVIREHYHHNKVSDLLHYHTIPTTPALRNVLRYGVSWSSGSLPHQFFGTLHGEKRSRSKIVLSWAYQLPDSTTWRIRGWAYPPHVRQSQQQEVGQRLQAVLGKPDTWLRALKVRYRTAEVTFASSDTFFQSLSSIQVQDFVNKTLPSEAEI